MYHPLAAEIPTKRMSLEAIKDLFTYLPQSKANPEDAEVRTKLFLACYSSLFPFLYTGGVGLSHSIGHAIGATYSIPHGITSCLSLAPTVHLKASNPEEARQIARIIPYIGKQSAGSDEKDAHIVGDAISRLVGELGHKTTLSAVSIPSIQLWSQLTFISTTYRLVMPKKRLLHPARYTAKITKILLAVGSATRYMSTQLICSAVKQIVHDLY
jgi:alcohol dehydrogenase class IV